MNEFFYRWGDISLETYLIFEYPNPKYTIEDCRDIDPAQ
jgi:hypothetical protein